MVVWRRVSRLMIKCNSRWAVCLSAMALLGTAACDKDAPTTGHRVRGALQVQAVLATVGEQLTVVVRYVRSHGPSVELSRIQRAIAGAGRLDVPIELDLTGCLVDATRVGGASAGCPVVASIALRDASGAVLDSTEVGPVEVRDGTSVTATDTPVILQAAATLAVEEGADQLGWPGTTLHLPVVVRLTDRAGNPIAGRTVAVVPTTGGGNVVASGALLTDTGGRVTIGYRLGPAAGAQEFRVETAAGAATVAVPVSVIGVAPRREHVTGGAYYSCAILAGGTRCWGGNDGGYLGNRAIAVPGDTALSIPLSRDPGFVALTANKANNIYSGNTCGLTAQGAVYCWGLAPSGELGAAALDSCAPFGQTIACNREPTLVPSSIVFVTIDVGGMGGVSGDFYSYPARLCGVSVAGDAYCWGENRDGGVGDSTRVSRSVPTLVAGGHKWIDVTTGMYFSCGITVGGDAYCWGRNQHGSLAGMLGTGDTLSSTVPRRVSGNERYRAIDAGYGSACALTVSGELRCWGVDPPNPGGSGTAGFGNSTVPVAPPGAAMSFTNMSVGTAHACAVAFSSQVFCWGRNRGGSLGDGSPTSAPVTFSYSLARVKTSVAFAEVGPGILQTCAIAVSLDVYCWGLAARGQLGHGTRPFASSIPVKVRDSAPVIGAPVSLQVFLRRPTFAALGSPCPDLSVIALDADGYTVAGVPVQFSSRTTGAVVTAASATTDAFGRASVSCRFAPAVGPSEFVVRLGTNLDSLVMSTYVQIAGPPARLEPTVSGSAGATAGSGPVSVTSVAVQVVDTLGLPLPGIPVQFSRITTSGMRFLPSLPTTVVTDSNGRAALASITPDTIVGVDTVRAQVATLPGQSQLLSYATFAGASARLQFLAVPSTVRVGEVITPAVTLTAYDRFGNVSQVDAAVSLSLTGTPGGVLKGTTRGFPDPFGSFDVISFSDLSVSAPGTYQLVATLPGLPAAISAPFTVVP